MRLEPRSYHGAVLFGPRDESQLVTLGDSLECIRIESGLYYPVNLLADAARLFEGVTVRSNHSAYGQGFLDRPLPIGKVLEAK